MLLNALDMDEKGFQVKTVIEGAAVKVNPGYSNNGYETITF